MLSLDKLLFSIIRLAVFVFLLSSSSSRSIQQLLRQGNRFMKKKCLIEKNWLYICLLIVHENSGLQAYSERCLLLGKLGYCMASSAGRTRRGRQKVLLLLWLLVKDEVARYGPKVIGHSITTWTRRGRQVVSRKSMLDHVNKA